MPSVVDQLVSIVGEAHVLVDPDLVEGYATDWTGRFTGSTPAVVRPGDLHEVAAVLAACDRVGAAVVPQGGNTGLVGGGVPLDGEVVLSTRRLDRLGPVDELAGQVTVGAGVTLAAVDDHVRPFGYAVGVDLAARGSATIGGMVATNAGGLRAMRHGAMRSQLVGIEAVLADGRVLRHLAGLTKDNTGYDLAGLVCGSEGTLAVVTSARLRLVPVLAHRVAALVGMPDVDTAVEALPVLRRQVPALEAVELMLDDGVELVRAHHDLPRPLDRSWPAYLLVEAVSATDPTDELAAAFLALDPGDVAVAHDAGRRAALWRYREAHTEAINAVGTPIKLDVAFPLGELAAAFPALRAAVAEVAPAATTYLFGHAGDGNVHVNVVGASPDEVAAIEEAVLGLVAARGGSISAEHGIGAAKRRFLHLARTPEEIAAFRALKAALDPRGTLNPAALLPPPG